MSVEKFIYGNLLTGERIEVPKHVLVLDLDPGLTEYVQRALRRRGLKSKYPCVLLMCGSRVLVESGPGLEAEGVKGKPVDQEMAKLLIEIHELATELSDKINALVECYFPELEEGDL